MASPRYALPVFLMLVLAGAGVFAWKLLDDVTAAHDAAARLSDATSASKAARDRSGANEGGVVRSAETRETTAAAAPDRTPRFPAERRHADWNAIVEDDVGRGVADVDVQVDSSLGGFAPGLEIEDDRGVHWDLRSGADGRVRVADLGEGAYDLRARAPDGRTARRRFAFRADPSREPLSIHLDDLHPQPTGVELTVVGVDRAPIAEATVELCGSVRGIGVVGDGGTPPLSAKSDARGHVRFAGVDWYQGLAFAAAPDGRVGSVYVDERQHEPETEFDVAATIVVQPAGRIVGQIVNGSSATEDALERALAGATVDAYVATSQNPWYWTFGRSYSAPVAARAFTFEALPTGEYSFVLHAPGGARLVLKSFDFGGKLENSVTPSIAVVKSGAVAQVVLTVAVGATIAGRVHRADGSPIANANVTAVFAPRTSNFPDGFVLHGVNVWRFDCDDELASEHPLTHVHARSDATGAYTLAGLQPGEQRVTVVASGLCFDRREGVVAVDGQTTTLDHELEAAGALQGIAPTDGYLGITRGDDAQTTAIAILGGDRAFTFGALRPGDYSIAQFHSDASIAPVAIAHATVVAGRTTFVDLTDAKGPVEIAGQVLDANGPVVDATVEYAPQIRRVDGSGRFAFAAFFPLNGAFELRVRSRRILWSFPVDATPFGNAGWQGVLRLGDESMQIEGRDARGAVVEGDVELWRDEEFDPNLRRILVRTPRLPLDGSGRLVVDRLVPGRYSVALRAANGAEVRTKVELPRTEVVTLVAPDCGTLDVTFVDADGRPVAHWNLCAGSYLRDGEIPDDVEGHDEWFAWSWAATDLHGRALLRGVRAGKVLLKAPFANVEFVGRMPPPPPVQRVDLRADECKAIEIRSAARRDGDR